MKDLISCRAKAIADNPEDVAVREMEGPRSPVVEPKVAKEDIGNIIGTHGRTVVAITTLLGTATMKLKKQCVLNLLK
jgi:predicted RNA-binding protein YlqC (UPF0109 family)